MITGRHRRAKRLSISFSPIVGGAGSELINVRTVLLNHKMHSDDDVHENNGVIFGQSYSSILGSCDLLRMCVANKFQTGFWGGRDACLCVCV